MKNSNKILFSYLKSCLKDIELFIEKPNLNKFRVEEVRLSAFKLQAFGKVMKAAFRGKVNIGSQIKESAKTIEDALGDRLYIQEMEEMAGSDPKKSKKVQQAKEALLMQVGVFEHEFGQLEKNIDALFKDWDIRALYLQGLKKEIKKIKNKIELMSPEKLEFGTHDLRRKIRWILMFITYPQGLFAYKKDSDLAKGTYIELKTKEGVEPITLTYKNLKELSAWVSILGKLKDRGLFKHYQEGLKDHNVTTKEIASKTREIKNQVLEKKILKKIRKEIKDGEKK